MSYQVLARKWRPQSFQQVVGQPHVITALSNALSENKVHHAYLFSGTRGVGKTSIARLLAKSLNCADGVTATPCGQCEHCRAIDQGRFVDLLEIDAASRTKVDDTRELLDNVQYKPAQGRYKVYLIDEVHMLSKHSFNALLKTLEEPPEYVKFLLATTDPQKLPITVLSRCLQFHLKAILPEQIEQQLSAILTHEQAAFDKAAINVIAKAADGSMRDALSLTDQALAFGAGHIEYEAVLKMLGTIDQSHLHYLLHFIASGNTQKVFAKIQELVALGADFAALHQDLANLCHQIALMQLQVNANITEKTAVQLLAERLTAEEVQLYYQIALEGYKDYRYAPNGKVALEMTVMRLLAFKPANYIELDESALPAIIQKPVIKAESQQVNADDSVNTRETEPQTIAEVTADQVTTTETIVPVKEHNEAFKTDVPLVEMQAPLHQAPHDVVDVDIAAPVNQPSPVVEMQNAEVVTKQETLTSEPDEAKNAVGSASSNINGREAENHAESQSVPSNSRNMLRSHRLKREALKKKVATTEEVALNQTQDVAEHKFQPNIVALSSEDVAITEQDKLNSKALNDTTQIAASEKNAPELPPLSSYQERDVEQATFDAPRIDLDERGGELASTHSTDASALSHVDVVSNDNVHDGKQRWAPELAEPINQVSLSNGDNVVDAEVDVATYVDDKITDPWFLDIKSMQLVGFEKLLAKNCTLQRSEDSITLTLHEPQQHLLNNSQLVESVRVKITAFYGQQYDVNIKSGDLPDIQTPIQLEVSVYQQYLDNAKLSLKQDLIVQTLVRDYSAKVYENSVVPL